ncbi:MAG: four helix bundle protein [Bacteroidales bacterium]|jgi:four helix bundle protein|nr:four helix bundle protein [Bacteroidales bacterium]
MDNILSPKSYRFALEIISLYKCLSSEKREFILSKQLLRSGTSIGALVREAEHAQSKADFLNKINIALKEANETEYWLLLLKDTDYLTEREFETIHKDSIELIKILASIVKTTKTKI